MLYVFHVDIGRMLSFHMTVAMSSVENLKNTIERLHDIPAASIVLLVSGGEMLTNFTQVSCYSAGTDTNPIFMFLMGDVKLPTNTAPIEADIDLKEQIDRSLELPAEYETVVKRAQIALRMHDLARDEERMCERLVHEQHLQQQGWSAVVANMEDVTEEFRLRFLNFCEAFSKHLEKRVSFLELLRNFNDDLSKLSRIPILPGLMPLAEADFHGFDDFLENDDVFSSSSNQQQSVLMVGAKKATATVEGVDAQKLESNEHTGAAAAAVAAGGEDNADDKSLSSTSTSPNKKLKMANESNEEIILQTSQTSTTSNTARRLNLLQWITPKGSHNALKTMSDESMQALATFDEDVFEKLKQEVKSILQLAKQSEVKEIRGLSERLCKLEEFRYKIKSMVKDQRELSTAFQQNQNRAINLRDASILPDLCNSHQSQLLVMSQNHQKIREHRRCIAKAKDELGANLHARLRRIVYIENAMSEFDNRLLFYHRCLRRAERHINIIEQIHQTPNMYVAAVTEVMRRKIFSNEFHLWASKLAEDFDSIHTEEMKRRQQFNMNFEGHFLNILFPGMADMPPAFANENPLIFDTRLPNITRSDIDVLTSHLPDMASHIQLPDMEHVVYFFVSRSGTHQRERFEELLKKKQKEASDNLKQQMLVEDEQSSAITLSGKMPSNPILNELRKDYLSFGATGGEESETDTETEFEQVPPNAVLSIGTSTSENLKIFLTASTITERLFTQSAETLTDENSETLKEEVTHMRAMLGAMSKLALECTQLARNHLDIFRQESNTQREDLQKDIQLLNDAWNVLLLMQPEHAQQQEQNVLQLNEELNKIDLELQEAKDMLQLNEELKKQDLELQEVKEQDILKLNEELKKRDLELQEVKEQDILKLNEELKKRDLELQEVKEQNRKMSSMEAKCADLESQLEELKEKLKLHESEKEQAVVDAREKLMHEHKTEIESLRQRFKLMTSMERSPSDLSLETPISLKDNVIEKQVHENNLAQLRSDLEAEKEKAITAAIEMERSIWQSKIFPLNSESVMANVSILKEMLEEKERQLEHLREKDLMLTKENYQLKTRMDALTNEEGNSWLKEKIDYLNRDKCRLEEELNQEKSRRLEMETSFATIKGPNYEQSPLPRSKSTGSSHKFIVFESCSKGDLVFVVWSIHHAQYVVVQNSPSFYFVHGESLAAMNLHIPQSGEEKSFPVPFYGIGRVVDKEYCQARKDDNRYRVTRGSRFYRIKLAPFTSRQTSRRERLDTFSTSISRSISQCESHSEASQASSSTAVTSTVSGTSPSLSATTSSSGIGSLAKDVVDAAGTTIHVATSTNEQQQYQLTSANNTPSKSTLKERTLSITSVTEEDEEPVSFLSEGCRYISVSEEDENSVNIDESIMAITTTTTTSTNNKPTSTTNLQQQTTVITEQPTATASTFVFDFMLASADINTTTQQNTTTTVTQEAEAEEEEEEVEDHETLTNSADNTYTLTSDFSSLVGYDSTTQSQIVVARSTTLTAPTNLLSKSTNTTTSQSAAIFIPSSSQEVLNDKSSPSVPTSIGTNTSEDSDEYRSLEPKDDTDFPITE